MASTWLSTILVLQLFASIINVTGFSLNSENCKEIPTVSGTVRGFLVESGYHFAFLGIPYAAPPTGPLRFKPPLQPEPWNTTFIANRKVICPQGGIGDEDCLVLNAFVPIDIERELRPVLVYIHGASFLFGSGPTEGSEPLTKLGVIVVTINYRLGPLGFLCLANEEAPGNAGLKDQVAALKWVQDNIKNFGGDPDKVTLYGTDSGAACVELLLLSNASRSLFQKAVIESGSSTSVWAIDRNPLSTAQDLARAFTVSGLEHPQKLLEIYKNVPADVLSRVNMQYSNSLTGGTVGFAPCIELKIDANSVINYSPEKILKKGQHDQIPTMFIFSSIEGLFLRSKEYYALNYKNRMEANFAEFLPADLVFESESEKINKALEIKHFYFGNNSIDDSNISGYLNYFGDSLILKSLLNTVEIFARREKTVYLMEFAKRGKMGGFDEFYKNISAAGHGDFSHYVLLNRPVETSDDRLIIDRASSLLANFMHYGNPTPNGTDLLPTIWPAVETDRIKYLHFDDNLKVLSAPYSERIQFWNKLYFDSSKDKIEGNLECDASCTSS